MKKICLVLYKPTFLTLAIMLLFASDMRATDFVIPSFSEIVRSSSVIARVTINTRRDATLQHEGEEHNCGSVYSARVVELLKGNNDDGELHFLSGNEDDFSGYDVDYLIFVLDSTKFMLPSDKTLQGLVLCRIRSAPLVTSGQIQVMIPFRRVDQAAGSKEDLQMSRISAASLMGISVREVEIDETRYGLVEWNLARAAIQGEVNRQRAEAGDSREGKDGCAGPSK